MYITFPCALIRAFFHSLALLDGLSFHIFTWNSPNLLSQSAPEESLWLNTLTLPLVLETSHSFDGKQWVATKSVQACKP